MADPRSSHFGLRNEAPNLTNDTLLPLHASTKLHWSLGVTGGSISRNYVNTNSNLHKTNTKIWIFLPETPRFVQKTNPNCRVMMEVDAGSTPPNSRYVVSSYCVNTNSEITFFWFDSQPCFVEGTLASSLAFIHNYSAFSYYFSSFLIEIPVQFRRQILLTQTRIESPFERKSESRYR